MLKKWSHFIAIPLRSKLLLFEAYMLLAWARLLKLIPFAKVAPTLGVPMKETPYERVVEHEQMLGEVAKAIRQMSRYTWWESECLVKGIAAMKLLKRRKIASTLYLGTAKDASGKLIAHAWLRSGPYYITGVEEMGRFTVVGLFGNQIKREKEHRYGQNV